MAKQVRWSDAIQATSKHFDQFGETTHSGTLIELVALPCFTYLPIAIINVCVHIVNVISIRFGSNCASWRACLSIMLGSFDND